MPTLKKAKKQTINRAKFTDPDATRQKVYNTRRWRKLRAAYLIEHPLCEICKKDGVLTPAIDVHHRDSFTNYDGLQMLDKAFDSDNLVALCKKCHATLHKNGRTHGLEL